MKELISAKKTQLTKRALEVWREEWTKERYHRTVTLKSNIQTPRRIDERVKPISDTNAYGENESREFLFWRKVPGIEDGRCEFRQGNQTAKHVLLESRLYSRGRRDLWTEEAKKARKEGGRSLDIVLIITDGSCVKKR